MTKRTAKLIQSNGIETEIKLTSKGWTSIYQRLKIFNKKLADKTPKIRHKIVDEAKNEVFKKSAKSGEK